MPDWRYSKGIQIYRYFYLELKIACLVVFFEWSILRWNIHLCVAGAMCLGYVLRSSRDTMQLINNAIVTDFRMKSVFIILELSIKNHTLQQLLKAFQF
jgi:hypothetical protein